MLGGGLGRRSKEAVERGLDGAAIDGIVNAAVEVHLVFLHRGLVVVNPPLHGGERCFLE